MVEHRGKTVEGLLTWADNTLSFEAPDDESGFWHNAARVVFKNVRCPDVGATPVLVSVSVAGEEVSFAITARGTFDDGRGEMPSPFVVHKAPDMDLRTFRSCRGSADYDDPAAAYEALCGLGGAITFKERGLYDEAYLAYASPHTKGGMGSYKFYRIVPDGDKVRAQYGRIGTDPASRGFAAGARWAKSMPSWLYWLRYQEKLAKGYVDLTAAYLTGDEQDMLHVGITPRQVGCLAEAGIKNLVELCRLDEEALCSVRNIGPVRAARIAEKLRTHGMSLKEPDAADEGKTEADPVSVELYELLFGLARGKVDEELAAGAANVTAAMVRSSRELLLAISGAKTVEEVNRLILSLMLVCPRRADNVSRFLVGSMDDVGRAIEREEELVLAMEACVTGTLARARKRTKRHSMADFGIGVFAATEKETSQVLDLMRDPYTGVPHGCAKASSLRIWRVEPAGHRRRFEAYCKARGITDTRMFWHGSSGPNWASIVTGGLKVSMASPHGMFGAGLYSANYVGKSLGYVSGGCWRGGSGKRILGVYDVAYGRALHVQRADHSLCYEKVNGQGFDCVHAFRGHALRNDEIVVYDDAAMCLRYLVQVL